MRSLLDVDSEPPWPACKSAVIAGDRPARLACEPAVLPPICCAVENAMDRLAAAAPATACTRTARDTQHVATRHGARAEVLRQRGAGPHRLIAAASAARAKSRRAGGECVGLGGQARSDILNALGALRDGGAVVVHDVSPSLGQQAGARAGCDNVRS